MRRRLMRVFQQTLYQCIRKFLPAEIGQEMTSARVDDVVNVFHISEEEAEALPTLKSPLRRHKTIDSAPHIL